jgi:FtsZ-interacting cell division protein ZipA
VSELRWTLLLLGVLFIAVLAWWELRRPRQARGGDLERSVRAGEAAPHVPVLEREPTLTLPEMRAREPVHELPVVEIPPDALLAPYIEPPPEPPPSEPEEPALEELAPEPIAAEPQEEPPQEEEQPSAEEEAAPALASEGLAAVPVDPIVEWPDESVRRIIGLRLVAPSERFSGRAIRQALSAEGFVLGKFSIFHRAGPDGRAVVSAASLTKPGTFDREAIDMQRFSGLSLFVVIPGPLAPVKAYDELIAVARNLNERLEGALQDERGGPLTPMRAVAIRESLLAESAGHAAPH